MRLLLDTHALLWWLGGTPLAEPAHAAVADPANLVAVSAASVWEVAIKRQLGKVEAPDGVADAAASSGFDLLPITGDHAERAGGLPLHHRDPFDRMLAAQAQAEGLTVVTRDPAFRLYGVDLLTC